MVDGSSGQHAGGKLPGGDVQGAEVEQLHDLGELHGGVGRELKLLGLGAGRPKVVTAELHVCVDPCVDGHRAVVQPPLQHLLGEEGGSCDSHVI